MEPKEMKVIDVLRESMKILSELRIPVKELQVWSAVSGVIQNTQMCIEAMERAEAEAKAKKEAEEGEKDADNVIQMDGEGDVK